MVCSIGQNKSRRNALCNSKSPSSSTLCKDTLPSNQSSSDEKVSVELTTFLLGHYQQDLDIKVWNWSYWSSSIEQTCLEHCTKWMMIAFIILVIGNSSWKHIRFLLIDNLEYIQHKHLQSCRTIHLLKGKHAGLLDPFCSKCFHYPPFWRRASLNMMELFLAQWFFVNTMLGDRHVCTILIW